MLKLMLVSHLLSALISS